MEFDYYLKYFPFKETMVSNEELFEYNERAYIGFLNNAIVRGDEKMEYYTLQEYCVKNSRTRKGGRADFLIFDRKHDECYGTCGKTKEQCDLELCTNGACLYGFLLDGALSGPSQSAYDKAQKESGCDDCNK